MKPIVLSVVRDTKTRMREKLTDCIKKLSKLDLVDRLVVAVNHDTGGNYIYIVLREDTTVAEMGWPRFEQLDEARKYLQLGLENILPVNVQILLPSFLGNEKLLLQEEGFQISECKIKEAES